MNNLIEKVEKEQIKKLTSKKTIPAFRTGDTIKVTLKIIEGDKYCCYYVFHSLSAFCERHNRRCIKKDVTRQRNIIPLGDNPP